MFALYPYKGLADHKLVARDFPWLDDIYLVDIVTVVPSCVLSKALEIQFPLRANKADQTYPHIVAGLGDLSADPFGLDLGCQHLVNVGFYVFPCSANMLTCPDSCRGTFDCGMVCIIVVLNYLGQDIKVSARVTCGHILHYHAFYCSIKSLHLPVATWLIWEAGNMLDMQVIKQLIHSGVGELATIVTL